MIKNITYKLFSVNHKKISEVISEHINPKLFKVIDNSAAHGEPSDSHFSILIVSNKFDSLAHLKRHKMVFDIFKQNNITDDVHAISLTTKTESEYEQLRKK